MTGPEFAGKVVGWAVAAVLTVVIVLVSIGALRFAWSVAFG